MLVTKNVVTREEVIAAVKELAARLGRSPRYPELIREMNVTRRQIQRLFGGWAGVLEDSGCDRVRLGGGELTTHELWHDWAAVARKAQRIPTIRQYEKFSRYSVRPLKDRFKAWDRIPAAMMEYGNAKGLWAGWEDVRELMERALEDCTAGETAFSTQSSAFSPSTSFSAAESQFTTETRRRGEDTKGREGLGGLGGRALELRKQEGIFQAIGTPLPEFVDPEWLFTEPLNLAPMAMAPANENGVLFMLGTLARELGFVVLKVQPGFPDLVALRRLANGKWQWVRIEIEFESRNFVLHGHDVRGCELIVCWEHNWEGCPLEVVELRRMFGIG